MARENTMIKAVTRFAVPLTAGVLIASTTMATLQQKANVQIGTKPLRLNGSIDSCANVSDELTHATTAAIRSATQSIPDAPASNTLGKQDFGGRSGFGRQGYGSQSDYSDRRGVPDWELEEPFQHDVFRFVRLKYQSWEERYHRMGRWATDFPDSELNFSFRLQQLTSLKVNPDPIYLEITDERLFDYPFIYMIEPGALFFTDSEVPILRRYLLNGGFMMVDDFWGEREWANFASEIARVFPDRPIIDVPLEHPIFHCVYDLPEKPQVPSIHHWRSWGDSSERGWDSEEVHFRAILDDQDRIMVFICHNTDLGDGWEREAESREYFELFSEKKAYPMGINIVFYAMTH